MQLPACYARALRRSVPRSLRRSPISCGWPSQNGRARHNRVIGECWKVEPSAVGRPEIFVSPMLADSIEVGAVLVHELMHAAHPDAGHKGASKFKRAALALGLTGRMTATSPGDQLRHDLVALVEQIGQAVSPRRDPSPAPRSASRAPGCSSSSVPGAGTLPAPPGRGWRSASRFAATATTSRSPSRRYLTPASITRPQPGHSDLRERHPPHSRLSARHHCRPFPLTLGGPWCTS